MKLQDMPQLSTQCSLPAWEPATSGACGLANGIPVPEFNEYCEKRQQGDHTWLSGMKATYWVLVENTTCLLICVEVWQMYSATVPTGIQTQNTVWGSSEHQAHLGLLERRQTLASGVSYRGVQGEGLRTVASETQGVYTVIASL